MMPKGVFSDGDWETRKARSTPGQRAPSLSKPLVTHEAWDTVTGRDWTKVRFDMSTSAWSHSRPAQGSASMQDATRMPEGSGRGDVLVNLQPH